MFRLPAQPPTCSAGHSVATAGQHHRRGDQLAMATAPSAPTSTFTHKHVEARALKWLERFGAKACLLPWLPIVGDPLPRRAGWLRCCSGLRGLAWRSVNSRYP